ncbi:hypothetical protein HDU97_008113 [Phlyctochytrium planicorne]|nr:hypothetical protein HDU97_008113 [Phlyctochytrium planicorne]
MISVEIAPLPTNTSLIQGHWGLDAVITFVGLIRIIPEASLKPLPPPFHLETIAVSIEGKIFTSNGDARKHSPYEAFTFLKLGPIDLLSENPSRELLPVRYQSGGRRFEVVLPPPTTLENGIVEIPFRFPVTVMASGGKRLYPSLEASNPEWGFGARIEYKVKASVTYLEGYVARILNVDGYDMEDETKDDKETTEENTSSKHKKLSTLSRIGSTTAAAAAAAAAAAQTKASLFSFTSLKSNLRNLFTSSVTVERDINLVSYTPASLIRALRTEGSKIWSSVTDAPPDSPMEASIAAMMEYQVKAWPLTVGPGDDIHFSFWVRPKTGFKVKVGLVRITLEELQGVGVDLGDSGDAEKTRLLGELTQMMADTTLGRKWMSKLVMGWEGKESIVGEFWKEQQITLTIPPLMNSLPPQTFFGRTRIGINPSGKFANRIQIEHKLNIQIDIIISPDQPPISLRLSPESLFINAFDSKEAKDLISTVPGLSRQLEMEQRQSQRLAAAADPEPPSSRATALPASKFGMDHGASVPRYESTDQFESVPRYKSTASLFEGTE